MLNWLRNLKGKIFEYLIINIAFPMIYRNLSPNIKNILEGMKNLKIRDMLEEMAKGTETKADNNILKWQARVDAYISTKTPLKGLLELAKLSKTEADDKLITAFFDGIK